MIFSKLQMIQGQGCSARMKCYNLDGKTSACLKDLDTGQIRVQVYVNSVIVMLIKVKDAQIFNFHTFFVNNNRFSKET